MSNWNETASQIRSAARPCSSVPSHSPIPFEHIPDPISQKAPKQFTEQQLQDRYAHMKKWLMAGQMSSSFNCVR